jgi:phage terminase large subunit GpA-like protein
MPLPSRLNVSINDIPEHLLPRLGPSYRIKLNAGERKVWRKRRQIPVSKWSERHRVVTKSSVPGKWRNATTPYLAGVMDAAFFPSVQTIIVCAAPQTGKSESVNNCIGYAIDRKPGDVLFVYPDEQTARENSKDRIQPMIASSYRLKGYMTGLDDDTSYLRVNLQHMQIYLGWARSASRLANKPLPYIVLDEIDKYPETAGKKEASPIALAEKRTRTFKHMRKIFKISTPTTEDGSIWTALTTEAQIIFDYWVRCPFCEAWQMMDFDEEHFKWPEDERDPERVEGLDLAWYECDSCRARWGDEERNEAVRNGEWRSRDKALSLKTYLQSFKPKKIGFHIPSWLSYFVGLSEVAANFLRGLKDKTALKDFLNADKAEPWKHYQKEREEDVILALRDERLRGVVPGGGMVAALTAGVDTQKHGFWYEIRAWGYGMDRESWQIREGYVQTFDALAQLLWEDEYLDADGKRYLVALAVQDAMGEKTAEVYNFCRMHRGKIFPFKGEQRMNQPFSWSHLEYYPRSKRPIKGGLKLLRGNVTFYKNELSNLLEIAPGDPGAWHYHSETTEEWARQMTAEYVDEKGLWQQIASRDNHAWDCSVYNLIAADVRGIKFRKKSKRKEQSKNETADQSNSYAQQKASSMLRKRDPESWMDNLYG